MSDFNRLFGAGRRMRFAAFLSLILLTTVGGSLTAWSARARVQTQEEVPPAAATTTAGEQSAPATAQPSDQLPQTERSAVPDEYVRPSGLRSHLRSALKVLGGRLEHPGKERLTMAGTLTHGAESVPFQLLLEYPHRLRLQEQDGRDNRLTVFDDKNTDRQTFVPVQSAAIETLVFDTPEGFFSGQARGAATRHLGSRFRLDGAASAEGTVGPSFYDVYEVTDGANASTDKHPRTKLYCLNSDSLLLELVKYERERDGEVVRVEVRLGDWRRVQGQMVPHRIERTENGHSVLTLDITSVAVGPRQEDGAFTVASSN